jgi:hypothetical protein
MGIPCGLFNTESERIEASKEGMPKGVCRTYGA